MKNLFREPLVQFLILGLWLFVGHAFWQKQMSKKEYTIHISAAEIQRQASIFAQENQRDPTDEDIKALLFAHVEEEILQREAIKLGLDVDDTIIRRRLAQKMRFVLQDTARPQPKNETELRDWFEDNKLALFEVPEKRGFSHIFLSPTDRDDIYKDAESMMSLITDENWSQLGDPFIEQKEYGPLSREEVKRRFGIQFTDEIFDLETTNYWHGPIGSAFGLHFVRINERSEPTTLDFETNREEILDVWSEKEQRRINKEKLENLLQKYRVEVEDIDI